MIILKHVNQGEISQESNECEFDDDCAKENNNEDDQEGYVVCTNRRCQYVTGECLEDADCEVRKVLRGPNRDYICLLTGFRIMQG